MPVLRTLQEHEYDRDGFREAILELFKEKSEKSVFRGMAIPTLRTLGLLVGFEREMHLSGDGALVMTADSLDEPRNNRAMQRVLAYIERKRGLDSTWRRAVVSTACALSWFTDVEARPSSDFPSRVRRWLGYLTFFRLIEPRETGYVPNRRLRSQLTHPIPRGARLKHVVADLYETYCRMARGGVGEPVVGIEPLHREFAIGRLRHHGELLLRVDFDALLERIVSRNCLDVHLHRSMGAEQGLFFFRGQYYQAMSVAGIRR
jgi:hypothetical protein